MIRQLRIYYSVAILPAVLLLISFTTIAGNRDGNSDLSMISKMQWAVDFDHGDTQKFDIQIEPELSIDLSEDSKLTVLGRFLTDSAGKLEPNTRSKAELRELYLETSVGDIFFTLGKQQIVWGKSDGLKVLDVLNPQDFREFILADFDDSRIPLWSLNTEITIYDSVLQLVLITDNTYNRAATTNSIYEFTSPLIVPSVSAGTTVDVRPENKPNRFFADADYALRFSSFWLGWDVTLNYLYHYNDTAVLFRSLSNDSPSAITIKPRYERSHLYGTTFSNAIGRVVVRGEIGYSTNQYFLTTDIEPGVAKINEFVYVLGLDWAGGGDSFLSYQLFQSRLSHSPATLVRDKVDTTMTFLFRQKMLNQTLVSEILWLFSYNLRDGLVRLKTEYEWNNELSIWAGIDIFYGNDLGIYGQFDDNDRFLMGMEWSL